MFCALRAALGVDTEQFLNSAAPRDPDTSYTQCGDIYTQPTSNAKLSTRRYVSNSSGKHEFYFSNDRRYIFKTEPRRTMNTFLEMLE